MTRFGDCLGLMIIIAILGVALNLEPEHAKRRAQPSVRAVDQQPLRFEVDGEFRSTPEKAEMDALDHARHELMKRLESRDPPIEVRISIKEIRQWVESQHLEKQTFSAPINETLYQQNVIVNVPPEVIRQLRQEGRLHWAGWVGGLLFGLFLLISAVWKTDEWTGGYLTRVIIAIALTAGIIWMVVGYVALPGD